MKSVTKTLLALTLMALTVSACGGGTSNTTVQTTTVGEELASLEQAYGQGLMSEKEYKDQRKKIMNKK